jgi:hypothetical protein
MGIDSRPAPLMLTAQVHAPMNLRFFKSVPFLDRLFEDIDGFCVRQPLERCVSDALQPIL